MKNCLNCGTEAFDDADSCGECGRAFSYRKLGDTQILSGTDSAFLARKTGLDERRPDGSIPMAGGAMAMAIGLLLVLLASNSPSGAGLSMFFFGGALAQLGLTFWLAGYIVKAMSFIQGKVE